MKEYEEKRWKVENHKELVTSEILAIVKCENTLKKSGSEVS